MALLLSVAPSMPELADGGVPPDPRPCLTCGYDLCGQVPGPGRRCPECGGLDEDPLGPRVRMVRCPACGYDLRSLATADEPAPVCPECGHRERVVVARSDWLRVIVTRPLHALAALAFVLLGVGLIGGLIALAAASIWLAGSGGR